MSRAIRWYSRRLKPVNPATAYRHVKSGILPAPFHPTPGISRWLRTEVEDALARRVAQRDKRGMVR